MLDQTVVPCDQQPETCARVVDQLQAGTSPAAVAAMYSNAIGIGLQVGTMMGQGVLGMQQINAPVPAAQVNVNSAARPTRSVYGQGGPGKPNPVKPAPVEPCKVGGVGWCSAQ